MINDIAQSVSSLVTNILENTNTLVREVRRDSMHVARESEALYRGASEQVAGLRSTVRATPRFAKIVREGIRIVASYRIHRAKAGLLTPEAAAVELEQLHATNAKRLHDLCVDLRGGVLKLGQFLSCRMDLLPDAYVKELSALQDRVPAIDTAQITAVIEEELGRPIDELFAEFDQEALAAASLAQVHRARLPSGEAVAVKVQVPGIEQIIEIDLAAMRVLGNIFRELVPRVDMATISTELARSIREELDYELEAANATAFAENFAKRDDIIVPAIIGDYSSKRVLTMELVDGVRMTDYLDEANQEDTNELFSQLISSYCQEVLEHGLLHADPHPGNFLVAEGPRLVILDFGSVQRYTPEERKAYAELAGALLAGNAEKIAELLQKVGFRTATGDSAEIVEFAEMMLDAFRADAAFDFASLDPKKELEKALELARKNPVVSVPNEFVMLGRVFGAISGLLLHYKPQVNMFALISPALAAALSAT